MTLIDTHCHLNLDQFDLDRESVLERAAQAGIERILIPGLNLSSSQSALELAKGHPWLVAAIGVHPTEASKFEPSMMNDFRKLAQHPKVRAIGEIGLDYYWDAAPHELQQRLLGNQLDLAVELNLPVVIHFREKAGDSTGNCASDLMRILKEWGMDLKREKSPLAERPGVLHSFSGTLAMAQSAMDLGFYIGVAGPITFEKSRRRQELVAALPLDRILIETDSPFQTPHPHRGKRNEPAYIHLIADKIALVRSCTTGQVATATSENARRLFAWE